MRPPDELDTSREPFARHLAAALEAAGWTLVPGLPPATFSARRRGKKIPVLLRQVREARRPIVVALLADAILRGRAEFKGDFVVVMAMPTISPATAEAIERYMEEVAPDQAFGFVDSRGLVRFRGLGLDEVHSDPSTSRRRVGVAHQRPRDLFSDLNQWLLKVLAGRSIPPSLLSVPRGPVGSAPSLAKVGRVSVPVAWRLRDALEAAGHLDDDGNLVMARDLMGRWRASVQRPQQRFGAKWLLPGRDPMERLRRMLADHRRTTDPLSACLGYFAACDALGLGHVRGAPVHVYVRHLGPDLLEQLGLSLVRGAEHPDVALLVAKWPEALFRAAVDVDGVPVSDVIQCWLDVSNEHTRGAEQAAILWRRVIGPSLASGEPEP